MPAALSLSLSLRLPLSVSASVTTAQYLSCGGVHNTVIHKSNENKTNLGIRWIIVTIILVIIATILIVF